MLPTTTPFGAVVEMIVERHQLGGVHECTFYNGERSGDAEADEAKKLPPSSFDMDLAALQFPAGTKFDAVKHVVTYDYAPFHSVLNLPQRTAPPVLPHLPRSAAQNEAAWAAAAATATATGGADDDDDDD